MRKEEKRVDAQEPWGVLWASCTDSLRSACDAWETGHQLYMSPYLDNERLQHRKRVLLTNDKVDSQIMEQLLYDARLNHDEDFVAPMVLALEEKPIDTLVR